jgi:hypothetical protein
MADATETTLDHAIRADPERWTYAMNEMTEEQNAALRQVIEPAKLREWIYQLERIAPKLFAKQHMAAVEILDYFKSLPN